MDYLDLRPRFQQGELVMFADIDIWLLRAGDRFVEFDRDVVPRNPSAPRRALFGAVLDGVEEVLERHVAQGGYYVLGQTFELGWVVLQGQSLDVQFLESPSHEDSGAHVTGTLAFGRKRTSKHGIWASPNRLALEPRK
ncbi:hypothetical protein [Microbacterium sp. 77mftsu3.1]|uniref:hypothetical protein n=1 Tax=Microbacterium sp. 77mftsu3.1 TaxID=1761802 RepID=UPI00035E0D21|nr:hypothetical protein [Microbacterium sp. 77mftsu3.1]SDH38161.1 hypothetical protein SAMN04488590_3187 [Microbacterium sp. 77mftsu3.1]